MATFKAVTRKKRADGTSAVYIRCTHNRQIEYLKTDMYISERHIKDGNITDNLVLGRCAIKISEYMKMLVLEDTTDWSVKEVVDFVTTGDTKVPFYPYCSIYIDKMKADGKKKPASNYQSAVNSFKKEFGEDVKFQDITSKKIYAWIEKLKDNPRAKQLYPTCIKAIFNAGLKEYNDYDRNRLRILNRPFEGLKIPKADRPQKRAVIADTIKAVLECKPDTQRAKLAQDVGKLIFYLVGINVVDLYYMEKDCYKDGKLCYHRHKTREERDDNAYIEITVRPELKKIFKKYEGKGDRLFQFLNTQNKEYSNEENFLKHVNEGLKRLCTIAQVGDITTYVFRHSWATIAQNKCGASTELVAFCLNHASAHKVAEGYIEKDYTPIDRMNDKVIDYVFNEQIKETKEENQPMVLDNGMNKAFRNYAIS